MSNPPAGWYPDANGDSRYWDGNAWTEQTQPAGEAVDLAQSDQGQPGQSQSGQSAYGQQQSWQGAKQQGDQQPWQGGQQQSWQGGPAAPHRQQPCQSGPSHAKKSTTPLIIRALLPVLLLVSHCVVASYLLPDGADED